jgi:predicted transcriptional regulator
MARNKVAKTITLSPENVAFFEIVAAETDRSLSWVIDLALTEWVASRSK